MLREAAGLPSFRTALSSRATLFDPGRSLEASPLTASSVLGSADATASPPACCCVVSRLDCFSGVRLPLAACEFPCVRFQSVVWSSAPAEDASTCPSDRQHSGLGGWLSLPTRSFRSGLLFMFSCYRSCSVWRDFHPQSRQTFTGAPHLDTATKDQEPGMMADREPSPARSAFKPAGSGQDT